VGQTSSGLPRSTDISGLARHVGKVPTTDLSASKTDFRCNPVTGHRHTSRSRRFSADNKLERRSNNVPIRKLRQRNLTKLEKGRNQASSRSYVWWQGRVLL